MEANENFVSVRKLTEDEARHVYSEMSKQKLIDMLIQCNKVIDDLYDRIMDTDNRTYIPLTNIPGSGNYNYYDCSDWEHCKNPFHDCVGCPLMFSGSSGGSTWTSSSCTISVTSDFSGEVSISDIDYSNNICISDE